MTPEKSLESYIEKKAEEYKEIIDDYAVDLSITRVPDRPLGKVDVEIHRIPSRRSRSKRETSIFALDILNLLFCPIMLIIPFFKPDWQVAWVFAVVLLFSVFTRSILMRIAALIVTSFALMFGLYIELTDVVMVVFGVNTITLGPILVAILMTALAAGSGIVHGLAGSTRYSGVWIIGLGFLMASIDTIIGYFTGVATDWLMLLSVHLVIYFSAFLVAWGLFYLIGRGIRWCVLAVRPRDE